MDHLPPQPTSLSPSLLFWTTIGFMFSFIIQTASGLISCPDQCSCTKGTVSTSTLEVSCVGKHLPELPHDLPYASSYRLLFAHNDITKLESRSYLDRTVYLDLSYNNLHNLTNKATKQLVGRVRYLHLDHNNLTCLPLAMDTTEVVASVNEITLHGNPWNCSCLEMILHKWIEDDHRQVVDTHSLQCYDMPKSAIRYAHQDAVHHMRKDDSPNTDHHGITQPAEDIDRKWCDLPKVKDSRLTEKQGFLAFLMTVVSIGVIFGGLGVLYLYKYMLKQREKARGQTEESEDTKAIITHV